MESQPNKADSKINDLISQLEEEMKFKQKALNHLKEAAKLINLDGEHLTQKGYGNDTSEKPNIASAVDAFLDSQATGREFTIEDVATAVKSVGIEATEPVRRSISAVLSRRVKNDAVAKIERGKFKKPLLTKDNTLTPVAKIQNSSFSDELTATASIGEQFPKTN